MTMTTSGYALANEQGEAIWFLGTRMTVKAGGSVTNGAFTFIEAECPAGFAPPPHIHKIEDEAFYLLDGTIDVMCGDDQWQVEPGGFVFLPKGIPHGFSVIGDRSARMLQLTTPAQFEDFASEVGVPADGPGLPPAGAPDIPRLLAAAARYQIDILPPPH